VSKCESNTSSPPADQAARWYVQLQEGAVDSDTFIAWQKWLNAAPENRMAYEEIEDTMHRLGRVPVKPQLPSAAEMAADDYDGSSPIAQWHKENWQKKTTQHRAFRTAGRHRMAIAASLAMALVLAGVLWREYEHEFELGTESHAMPLGTLAYRTLPGQRQVVKLPEGSKVTLDADTVLDVELEANTRALTLKRGEAFFQVAKDKTRPFIVRAGSTEVTAVGTAFNVRMTGDRTVVAVTEGKVEVQSTPKASLLPPRTMAAGDPPTPRLAAQVSAGEAISYVDDGNMHALPAAEAPLAIAWLQGRRQYHNEPLRYVLADLDRYTGKRIKIADEAAELLFTGTLDLQDSQAWLRGLAVAFPVIIAEKEDGTLIIALREGR
jgi:transmembrane sensor